MILLQGRLLVHVARAFGSCLPPAIAEFGAPTVVATFAVCSRRWGQTSQRVFCRMPGRADTDLGPSTFSILGQRRRVTLGVLAESARSATHDIAWHFPCVCQPIPSVATSAACLLVGLNNHPAIRDMVACEVSMFSARLVDPRRAAADSRHM